MLQVLQVMCIRIEIAFIYYYYTFFYWTKLCSNYFFCQLTPISRQNLTALPAPSSITKELENVVKAIAPKPQQQAPTQTTPQDQAQEVQKPPPRQDKIKVGISGKLVIYAIIVIIVLYILKYN